MAQTVLEPEPNYRGRTPASDGPSSRFSLGSDGRSKADPTRRFGRPVRAVVLRSVAHRPASCGGGDGSRAERIRWASPPDECGRRFEGHATAQPSAVTLEVAIMMHAPR